jgi:type VI secretion system protein ImpL
LEDLYVGQFREGILSPFDRALSGKLEQVAQRADPRSVAAHVNLLSQRIWLLQLARARETEDEDWTGEGASEFRLVLPALAGESAREMLPLLERCYLAHLQWQGDESLAEELAREQARLSDFLAKPGLGFSWLTAWANMQESLEDIRIAKYWGADVTLGQGEELLIQRAYTPGGWAAIETVVDEIKKSMPEHETPPGLGQFQSEYARAYFAQWRKFLSRFHEAYSSALGRGRPTLLAGRLAGQKSPYALILSEIPEGVRPAEQLAEEGAAAIPAWVPLCERYARLKDPEYQRTLPGDEDSWIDRVMNWAENAKRSLPGGGDQKEMMKMLKEDKEAALHVAGYDETLKQAADQALGPRAAFDLARNTYLESEVPEPEHPVRRNEWEQSRLRSILTLRNPQEDVFWRLLSKPREQIWSILLDEAERHVQRLWEEQVLAEERTGARGWELVEALHGSAGKISEFRENVAKPFLRRDSQRGYVPRELYADSLRFSPAFLETLNRPRLGANALDSDYDVWISAGPADRVPVGRPYVNHLNLELECGARVEKLRTKMHGGSTSFTWSPRSCSDVSLAIELGDATPVKRYTDFDAFIQFLKDFGTGSRVFRADEFSPQQEALLGAYNVSSVTVRYSFKGHEKALRLDAYHPRNVPRNIFP